MTPAISRHRDGVLRAVRQIVTASASHLDKVNAWAPDLRSRLVDFASRGKLIRGSLVVVCAEIYGTPPTEDIYRVAAGLELVQSFLLIHDDIMDEDRLRRGKPALFEQYRRLGESQSFRDTERFGESMGICAGDVAMLLAFEAIACTGLDALVQRDLICRLAREIADVGVAQMADVANGHTGRNAREEEILAVYRYKTGRYTFSLPLVMGARIAGVAEEELDVLGKWGELQGVIFQIRDDQLGLMEEDASTGKPSGSDISADKQTLHRLLLGQRAPGTEWEHVLGFFGGHELSAGDIRSVRAALQELSILDDIEARVTALFDEASGLLDQFATLGEEGRALLRAIAEYNRKRRQ